MAGTTKGSLKAAKTNKRRYGRNYYREIGRKGGAYGTKDGVIKGFAARPELARQFGVLGGRISRRGKAVA